MTITIADLVETFKEKYGVTVHIEKSMDTSRIRLSMAKGGQRDGAWVGYTRDALTNSGRTQMLVEQLDYQVRQFAKRVNTGPVPKTP